MVISEYAKMALKQIMQTNMLLLFALALILFRGHLSLFCVLPRFLLRHTGLAVPTSAILRATTPFGFIGLAAQTLAGPEEESISSYSPLGCGLLLALA